MRIRNLQMALTIILSVFLITGSSFAFSEDTKQEDYLIDGLDAGIKLHIRERVLPALQYFSKDNIVLFVHGATYPSPSMFDLDVKGYSFMEYLLVFVLCRVTLHPDFVRPCATAFAIFSVLPYCWEWYRTIALIITLVIIWGLWLFTRFILELTLFVLYSNCFSIWVNRLFWRWWKYFWIWFRRCHKFN